MNAISLGNIVKHVLADLVTLKRPVTASAVVAFVLAATHALGLRADAAAITAIIGAIGTVAALVEALIAEVKAAGVK